MCTILYIYLLYEQINNKINKVETSPGITKIIIYILTIFINIANEYKDGKLNSNCKKE